MNDGQNADEKTRLIGGRLEESTILIVDDNIKNIEFASNILGGENYEIAVCTSGKEALDVCPEIMPDLVLLDIMMPEMNGYEVCRKLKENRETRETPVVFLSARADVEDLVKGFEVGGVDYVRKPFNQQELISRIKTHLELKHSRDLILEQNELLRKEISERNFVEESLRKSEQKFRSVIEHSHDLILIINDKFKITYANEKAIEILQIPSEELIGKNAMSIFEGEGKTLLEERLSLRQRGLDVPPRYEVSLRLKNGSAIDAEISAFVVKDMNKNTFTVAQIRDVTRLKQIDKEQREFIDKLRDLNQTIAIDAQKLVALNDRIADSEHKLKRAVAAKDKFFSIVAHDLRSPFSGLLGLTKIMSEEYDQLSKEEIIEYSDALHKSSKNLYKLLENLLLWARIQQGSIEYSLEQVNLKDAVAAIVKLASQSAEQKKIEIAVDVDENHRVLTDKQFLDTILRNLLFNAVKYTYEEGKIEIFSEIENDSRVVLSVKDNGVGMDDDYMKMLFNSEKKISMLGTNNEMGSGLGLTLCKELIEKIGGEIWARSKPKEGSVFSISLEQS